MNTHQHILIVAGETSGDSHAANVVAALKKKNPNLTFSGMGGSHLHAQGVEIYKDLTKIAVVGFTEVLQHYSEFKAAFDLIVSKAAETKADAIILIDYPGFNLRLAKKLKSTGIKIIYYISPQVWAWKQKRVELIKKCVDAMFVIFPFEEEFYKKWNYTATFVGHPIIDALKTLSPTQEVRKHLGLQKEKHTIGLLPGSRFKEVDRHLPVMLDAAHRLHQDLPNIQFLLLRAPTISMETIENYTDGHTFPLHITDGDSYDAMNACDSCIVASGTATFEIGMLEKPMIVMYKMSWITWMMAKMFVKIPHVGMVNVLAKKEIVPELLQSKARGERVAEVLKNILQDEIRIAQIKSDLRKVKESLGQGNAYERTADEIFKVLTA